MNRIILAAAAVLCGAMTCSCGIVSEKPMVSYAGVRSSSYGISPFPDAKGWKKYAQAMKDRYPGSTGSFVWIVGYISGNGPEKRCVVNFPVGEKIDGVDDFPVDQNEEFLDMCDRAGFAVWLQVEPGDCDLASLAEATMRRYKKHPSVKGFGIDVEWYKPYGTDGFGQPITDELAGEIDSRIKAVDPRFNYFLKHWDERWMPPTYRSDIVFVNDSQGHDSLSSMKGEFSQWADRFAPNPVFFQIGYEADEDLWASFGNPTKELGDYLVEGYPEGREVGIIWVDFTLRKTMAKQGIQVD